MVTSDFRAERGKKKKIKRADHWFKCLGSRTECLDVVRRGGTVLQSHVWTLRNEVQAVNTLITWMAINSNQLVN